MALRTYTHPQGVTKQIDSNDVAQIAVAERKGYVYTPPPPATAEEIEAARQADITAAAAAQKDIIRTPSVQGQINLLMRAIKRVRKESKGQAQSSEKTLLDQLESLADQIEAIDAEEERLLADPNLTLADAVWP